MTTQTKERKSRTADKAAQMTGTENLNRVGDLEPGAVVEIAGQGRGIVAGHTCEGKEMVLIVSEEQGCPQVKPSMMVTVIDDTHLIAFPEYSGQTYFDEAGNIVGIHRTEEDEDVYEVDRINIAIKSGSNPMLQEDADLAHLAELLAKHAEENGWLKRYVPGADGELPIEGKDAPATQKDITGKEDIVTPIPDEVKDFAHLFLCKKAAAASAQNAADEAADKLLHAMDRHGITQVLAEDDMHQTKRLTVKRGPERLKVEKTLEKVNVRDDD